MEFFKERLKNGLTLVVEKRDLPITSMLIATRAGAAHENAQKKGIAHFSEHMHFKGTLTRGVDEINAAIEKVGGILNAFTSEEITAFWCKIPSKHFSIGAEILADLVKNPKFDSKDIDKELNVILSEISMYHDNPQAHIFDKIKEMLYKKPFGMSIAGYQETVSKLKRDDFLKWQRYYCPENLVVSIVGDIDIEEARAFIGKEFTGGKGSSIPAPSIKRKTGSFIEKRKDIDQTNFALALPMPSLSEKARYSAEIFNAILGEGMSSILHREIREKRGYAYRIRSYLEQEKSYGHAIIYAGIEKKNIKEVKEISLKEIRKMASVSSRDFEEAKEQKIGNWQLERESCDDVARMLAIQEIATKAEDLYDYPERISDVKLEDIRKMAKIKNYSTAILAPK
jgi:predicted Zn-dependent peptidase